MAEQHPIIHIRPALRPRLEFLAAAATLTVMAALCVWMALTRGRAVLDPSSGITLGALDPIKHILVGTTWAVAACSVLLALWSLWAVCDASKRLHIVIREGVLEWRPYLGRGLQIDLSRLRAVKERSGGLLRKPHLAVSWGRRRKPLKLMRKWYLPLDFKRLRQHLDQALATAERERQSAKGLAEASGGHSAPA